MSAEAFGKQMLQDVHEESLVELLTTLRTLHNPRPRSITGIPSLDKIIEEYRYPPSISTDQTTAFAFSSDAEIGTLDSDRNLDIPDDHDNPQSPIHDLGPTVTAPKPLLINVSVTKPGARPAATHLLNQLTTLSFLPCAQGGKQGCVVWIDLSNSFSAKTLYQHILSQPEPESRAQYRTPTRQPPIIGRGNRLNNSETLIKQALQHVHVIRCVSTRQLLSTLLSLPDYLLNHSEHKSFDRALNLIIIDSINHFHWIDRFDAEIARLEGPGAGPGVTVQTNLMSQVLNELKDLHQRFGCAVVYTSHQTQPPTQPPGYIGVSGIRLAPQMSPVTTLDVSARYDLFHTLALVTITPVSATVNVPKFAPAMTIEECSRDREKRAKAVKGNTSRWWFDARRGGLAVAVDSGRRKEEWWRERKGFAMEGGNGGVVFE